MRERQYKPETQTLLKLTEKSYDEYNTQVLPVIKKQLGATRTEIFERVLGEELPFCPGRRAFRTAVMVAMGEENIYREFRPRLEKPVTSSNGPQAKRP